MILGKAGLLRGYRATSHWVTRSILTEFGAIEVDERVVVDRNRVTGAGVTAGLDLGLRRTALLRDDTATRATGISAPSGRRPPGRFFGEANQTGFRLAATCWQHRPVEDGRLGPPGGYGLHDAWRSVMAFAT